MPERCLRKNRSIENQLTEKERLFCKHYLSNDFKGKAAAIEAGYSEKTAKFMAYKLLQKPYVRKFLAHRIKQVEKKLDVKFEQKVKLLWKTAKRCYGITDEELERIKNGEELKKVFNFEPEALIKAIAELNKMQGHYADSKHADNPAEDAEKLEEEIKRHEREF